MIALILALMFGSCPTEDSAQCVWVAQEQGNGAGTSFLALTDDIVIYLP